MTRIPKNKLDIECILQRHKRVLGGTRLPMESHDFRTYAVTSLAGGVGKSILLFNIPHYLSSREPTLLVDASPERGLSRLVFGTEQNAQWLTTHDEVTREMFDAASGDAGALERRAQEFCGPFARRRCFVMPASPRLRDVPLFLTPLLANLSHLKGPLRAVATRSVLLAMHRAIRKAQERTGAERVLIDTGNEFSGTTHLAWMAADALIVPVRAHRGSLDGLKSVLEMLSRPKMEYQRYLKQAGIEAVGRGGEPILRVHAIPVTHCGWNSKGDRELNYATREFIRSAVELAWKYPNLFTRPDVRDCFYPIDNFHSAGQVCSRLRVPIGSMFDGEPPRGLKKPPKVPGKSRKRKPARTETHQVGRGRKPVKLSDETVDRYKLELRALASSL